MSNRPYYRGRIAIGNRTLIARTCEACGLLLGKKHFQKIPNTWTNKCNSCLSKINRSKHGLGISHHLTDHVDQNMTLETATRKGAFWTLKELDIIVEALEHGISYKEIAILLNRSYYTIGPTIRRFGLKRNWPTREIWVIKFK